MNQYLSPLALLLCLVGAFSAQAQAPEDAAAKTVLWNLDRLDRLGEHKITLIGSPRLIDTPRGKAIEFDGKGDALVVDVNPLAGLTRFTAEVIFQPYSGGSREQRFLHLQENGSENRLLFETRLTSDNRWFLDTFIKSCSGDHTLLAETALHPLGPWYHAAVTVDDTTMRHYVNRAQELSTSIRFQPQTAGRTSIGARMNQVYWYKGAIRQIRITAGVLAPDQFLSP
jgi:hypothetical protein